MEKNSPENDCSGCSPFLSCGSCSGFTLKSEEKIPSFEFISEKAGNSFDFYSVSTGSEFFNRVWQPPQQVIYS